MRLSFERSSVRTIKNTCQLDSEMKAFSYCNENKLPNCRRSTASSGMENIFVVQLSVLWCDIVADNGNEKVHKER